MNTLTKAALTVVLLVSAPAFADQYPRSHNINHEQYNQRQRIQQGARSGQLTPNETGQIKNQEQSLQQEKRQYKSDGTLSTQERQDLHQDLNTLSKEIYQQKHDGQNMPRSRQ